MDMLDKFETAKAIKDRHPTETDETRQETAHADLRAAALAVVDSAQFFGRPINKKWGGYTDRTPESYKEGVMVSVSMRDVMRLRDILNGR